jgi:hypothetical protein
MASSEEVYNRLSAALKQKGAIRNCAACGVNDWTYAGAFVRLSAVLNPNETTNRPYGFPLLPVFCKNCGNLLLFNLLTLGFSDPAELELPDDSGQ